MKHALHRLIRSKPIAFVGKVGLTGLALWLVFRGVDAAALAGMLRRQNHAMLSLAAVLILCQVLLGALRWRLILEALEGGHPLPVGETLKVYYISVFFNCCLPGTVGGDVVRVWLAKSDRVPLTLAIHSVIIDRLIALAALGLLVVFTLPHLGDISGFDTDLLVPAILAAMPIMLWLVFRLDKLLAPFQQWRVVRWLLYFVSSLQLLFKHRRASVVSLLYALIAHASFCLAAYALAHSLGLAVTALQCLTLIPPVMLASTLPISIGGWGVREAGMVGMLALVGVPQAAALMLSIQLGLVSIALSLPGGLLWLACRRKASG